MGGSASRTVVRTASQNGSAGKAATEAHVTAAQQTLEQLPADSAVRKDAAEAAQYKAWRAAQEQADAAALEQHSERDERLTGLMHQAMQRTEGRIQFREHFLSMPESSTSAAMVQEVRHQYACVWNVWSRLASGVRTSGSEARKNRPTVLAEGTAWYLLSNYASRCERCRRTCCDTCDWQQLGQHFGSGKARRDCHRSTLQSSRSV